MEDKYSTPLNPDSVTSDYPNTPLGQVQPSPIPEPVADSHINYEAEVQTFTPFDAGVDQDTIQQNSVHSYTQTSMPMPEPLPPKVSKQVPQAVQPTPPVPPVQPTPPVQASPSYPQKTLTYKPHKLTVLFRNIGIGLTVLLIILATLFAYIILSPESPFAKFVYSQNFVKGYISSPSNQNSGDTGTANQLLGLDNGKTGTFTFANEMDSKSTVEVVEKVIPSVLSITVKNSSARNGSEVAGTGYIVSEDGLVVTNKHVVASACNVTSQSAITITAVDNTQNTYTAELLTVDPVYDIAILKIDNKGKKLPKLDFADPTTVKLGTEVLAVGNALGEFQNTVTKGIVSGLNRNTDTGLQDECTGSAAYADGLIQIDAAINPGNSGGPLVNAAGQVIGMNTFGTQGAQSIGLSIPSDIILSGLNSYNQVKQIQRARLGVASQAITPAVKADNAWLPVDYGEILLGSTATSNAVVAGSAAEKAGLQTGDIIVDVNGQKIQSGVDNPSPLRRLFLGMTPGQKITIDVLKTTGKDSNNAYRYEANQRKIEVVLGKVVFDLPGINAKN